MSGQMKREKYCNHLILYETNINDPIFTKKDRFPSTEKTISANSHFRENAQTIKAMMKDAASRKRLICRSRSGVEKNNIHFLLSSRE